jgi:hypothetical protein
MVLSRSQREKILLDWGVPFHQIAEGTRTALRVKNQRRQTIVNSGKVAKLEETFEGASRRLKSALSIGRLRSQDEKMNHVSFLTDQKQQQQQQTSASRLPRSPPPSKNPISRTRDDSCISDGSGRGSKTGQMFDSRKLETVEPENDIFDKLDMKVDISSLATNSPVQAMMMMKSSSRLSRTVSEIDDGIASIDGFTLGATTLGNNSATSSQLEMERFYQELELECFGELNDLPSMVGQTLEVPVPTIARDGSDAANRNENVIDRRGSSDSLDETSVGNSASSNPQSASFANQLLIPTKEKSTMIATEGWKPNDVPYDRFRDLQYHQMQQGHTMFHQFREAPSHSGQSGYHVGARSQEASNSSYYYPNFSDHPPQVASFDDPREVGYSRDGLPSRSRQNSHDSYDFRTQQQNHHEYGCYHDGDMMQHVFGSDNLRMHDPSIMRCERGMETGSTWCRSTVPALHNMSQSVRSSTFDGPQIRHMPLSSHLSPTQWMEGPDTQPAYFNSTVTIMEDSSAMER